MAEEQKKPIDWEALAAEKAETFGLPVEDLKREVQREWHCLSLTDDRAVGR